jgi:hypothetical protein
MLFRGTAFPGAVLALCLAAAPATGFGSGPPAIPLFPDGPPVEVAFFFPSGGPLERFTARPGAWYAIFRLPMSPGRPYDVVIGHAGDPARMKVFALDNHPFDPAAVKQELLFRKSGSDDPSWTYYGSAVSLPRDSAVYGIFLLLEWNPPPGKDGPIPVEMQATSADRFPQAGRGGTWWQARPGFVVESPLQSRSREPVEIQVPRAGGPGKERHP